MANKTPTLTEPNSDSVTDIRIRCDGQGNVTLLVGAVQVQSDDASVKHEGQFEFDVGNLPAAVQTAVDNLASECLTRFKNQHGWS